MSISMREWQSRYLKGLFSSPDIDIQIEAGWYDWSCSGEILPKRTALFGNVITKLTDSAKLNLDAMYVWFNGNLPVDYPHYEDFRIADLETQQPLYVVSYKEPYNGNRLMWSVYDMRSDFEMRPDGSTGYKCIRFKTTKQMIRWFNQNTLEEVNSMEDNTTEKKKTIKEFLDIPEESCPKKFSELHAYDDFVKHTFIRGEILYGKEEDLTKEEILEMFRWHLHWSAMQTSILTKRIRKEMERREQETTEETQGR